MSSDFVGDALDAIGFKPDEREEETQWFTRIWQEDAVVAVEQCCDEGILLPAEIRETRLRHFPLNIRIAAEFLIKSLPDHIRDSMLWSIYWFVRIERAKRTGSPVFNPDRSTTIS